jgi:hypothetical protein
MMPEFEFPVVAAGRAATAADQVYVTVLTYTVPKGYKLHPHELNMNTGDYTRTMYRITINGVPVVHDFQPQVLIPLRLPHECAVLQNEVIELRARSTDGVAITATATLTGTLEAL